MLFTRFVQHLVRSDISGDARPCSSLVKWTIGFSQETRRSSPRARGNVWRHIRARHHFDLFKWPPVAAFRLRYAPYDGSNRLNEVICERGDRVPFPVLVLFSSSPETRCLSISLQLRDSAI